MLSLFDTHSHLCDSQFDPDREQVLVKAFEAGVSRIVEIADCPQDWEKCLELSRRNQGKVFCALGFHPHYADQWDEKQAGLPDEKVREICAIGEIGLDYVKSQASPARQALVFKAMLKAAFSRELPVIIHCREAYGDLFPILEEALSGVEPRGRFAGVIHCFSGTAEDARRAVALRFALGADGPVTYPKNEKLREAIGVAGLQNVVLETDSPYLPPQGFRGQRNEPSRLIHVAEGVSKIFGVSPEEAAAQTTQNALELFRLESLTKRI